MTTPDHSPSKEQQSESLEDRVGMLFEELGLAVKWQRPSILLAIYASDLICAEAQLMLEKRLTEIGQSVARLTVSSEQADIPMLLSRSPEREKTIFFVKKLKLRSRQGGDHAYRALN